MSVFRLTEQCALLGMAQADNTCLANCASCKDAAVGPDNTCGAPAPSRAHPISFPTTSYNMRSGLELNRRLGAILNWYCPFGNCLHVLCAAACVQVPLAAR